MSRRSKQGVWKYLDELGVLENGTDAEIKEAKREYRKQYFNEYKKHARKEKPEFIISLCKKSGEYDRILTAAKKHGMKTTSFIRAASLAYIEQRFLVPNRFQVAELHQLLLACLNEIKSIVNTKEKYFWQTDSRVERIEKRIQLLEIAIHEHLTNPQMIRNDSQDQTI